MAETSRKRAGSTGATSGQVGKFIAGIISANADNDPAGITTYAVAGSQTGYRQLWLMVLALPMLVAIQSMCARIGDVTHQGLGAVIRDHFPKPLAYLTILSLLLVTILMIGADMTGISAALELITGIRFLLWLVPVAALIWVLVLFLNFETFTRYIAVLTFVFVAYIFSGVMSHPNWGEVLRNIFLPPLPSGSQALLSAVGILGATFSPPLFFWQAKEEIEEKGTNKLERARHLDALLAPGFIFAQVVTLFIMISTASVLYSHHQTIQTAQDAARALVPLAGPAAKYLFGVGLIASGLVAIPVLSASAGYMVAELFGWKQSLSEGVDQAKGFYIVITLSLFTGVEIALSGVNPVLALYYSQVLGGLVGPLIMGILLLLANRRKIMGNFTNKWFDNLFGGISFLVMTGMVVLLVIQWARGG